MKNALKSRDATATLHEKIEMQHKIGRGCGGCQIEYGHKITPDEHRGIIVIGHGVNSNQLSIAI